MATGVTKRKLQLVAQKSEDVVAPLPNPKEPAIFSYSGKLEEEDILAPTNRTYVAVDKSKTAKECRTIVPNAFVLGDNYFAMKMLLPTLKGKVKLIYLDPPFATGFSFQSRKQTHAYDDAMATTPYIEFMRRRLVIMRELLSSDGSIYVHIGHQALFHLKVIMDEVFGSAAFRNLIVRRKCSSKNYTKLQYPNLNDYILFYTKGSRYTWNQPTQDPTKEWLDREYSFNDSKGRFKLVPVHAPGIRHGETGQPWRGKMPPPGKHWQYKPSKLDEFDRAGEIHWSKNNNPRRKVYLSADKKRPLTDYWDSFRDAHHQSVEVTGYPTEKNFDLLKTIVSASSNPGDIVLDPFVGSGTTLHAAHELNRKWLGIDESVTAAKAVMHRMLRGMSRMGDFVEKSKTKDLFADLEDSVSTKVSAKFDLIVDKIEYEKHKKSISSFVTSHAAIQK